MWIFESTSAGASKCILMSNSSEKLKTFVVFGASGGIGSRVTQDLLDAGHRVLAASRNPEKISLERRDTNCLKLHAISLDSPDSFQAAVDSATNEWDRVDGIVNCIGGLLLKPAHATSLDEWNNQILIHLTSSFLVMQAGINALKTSKGSLVFISSIAASRGLMNHEAVAAAKAGIEGLVRSAAATYAPSGVRINAVAPGLVDTPMTQSIFSSEIMHKASVAMHPLNRTGTPDDISSAICWLLDSRQSWMTGQVIHVDGGMSAVQSRNR